MKIPYMGLKNSLDEAPLFFWTFADSLKEQGMATHDAAEVAYQAYCLLMTRPETALTAVGQFFFDAPEKQTALTDLVRACLNADSVAQNQLNPKHVCAVDSFCPECREAFETLVQTDGNPYKAYIIVDSARIMAQDLKKEYAVNSFCAGCAIYGVSREDYNRIQQKVFKYFHTPETLKKAADLAKVLILK